MRQLFDNIVWHALSGPHLGFSTGTDEARRYSPGFSLIIGFVDAEHPDFDALADYCEPGERFYCDGWSGDVPQGWRIEFEATVFKMLWEGESPSANEESDSIRLRKEHVPQGMELASLTHPGPFGPRTIELGEYFGYFHGERLIAMAGERLRAGTLREISGVCTHPDFQGQGLARKLMSKLIRRELQRGELPCLHVKRENEGALGLYERLGFRKYKESVLRVVSLR